ncbi:MAG: TetR family transcriptional regulator, partial [Ramlibacter sp.]|nr:TetR family transcriptional regulator [Ramlibacter sp.]
LPRGRSSLSLAEAREAQRRRLVRASISAFAELGYADTTIADIVGRARVARQVFYELYESKEDCFLDAESFGRAALLGEVFAPLATPDAGTAGSDAWIRGPIRAYLRTCLEEREFSRAWAVEFPNAGPRTLANRNQFFAELSRMLRQGHERALALAPERWQPVPELYYAAAIGGFYELVYRHISENRFAEMPGLEDTVVSFIARALGYRPRD